MMPGGVAAPVHPGPGSMAPGMAPQHNVYQENIDINLNVGDLKQQHWKILDTNKRLDWYQ